MRASPVAAVFADEWTPLVATLVRQLGDLQLAEDAAGEAFAAAARQWPRDGTPGRPGAWLLTAARRRAIDVLRRDEGFNRRAPLLAEGAHVDPDPLDAAAALVDDQLALVFGCCHPALAQEAQVALTLRHVNGLSTAQVAAAFLVPEPTMARRLHRAVTKIRAAGVPFRVPEPAQWGERLDAVLQVVYLVFTAGHTATRSDALVRGDLCDEARWLADLLGSLVPDDPEVLGLAALLALTDARRAARLDVDGGMVTLEHQDRSRWDDALAAEGMRLLARAWRQRRLGPFQVQAAIAVVHASAASWATTDWPAIARHYDVLTMLDPSPVVRLNAAVAVGLARGPAEALALVEELVRDGRLERYHYLWVARADLLRRLGRSAEARGDLERALELVTNDAEATHLAGLLAALG